MLSSGSTTAFGKAALYEYRREVTSRTSSSLRLLLEVRFKPQFDMSVDGSHGTRAHVGSSQPVYREVSLSGSWTAGEWTDWRTVFDGDVPAAMGDSVLYVEPSFGPRPFEYSDSSGPLEGGVNIGEYVRPSNVISASVVPASVAVENQNYQDVKVTWSPVQGATYRVYLNTQRNLTGVKVVAANTVAASCTFNPKQCWLAGANWRSGEITDGTEFYVGVEARDGLNVASSGISWAGPVRYGARATLSPSGAYVMGFSGVRNEVAVCGERARLYYSGEADGSYPLARFVLRRQDGVELEWTPSDARLDPAGRYVELDFPSWPVQNAYVQFELRAYDSMGHPAYMQDGTWFKFSPKHYGGLMGVYGKPEFLGSEYDYLNLPGDEELRNGFCYVYDGSGWRRAASVYVYTGTDWRTAR